jgi:peptidoglycan/LPS O-acetylase OafA/YrhL
LLCVPLLYPRIREAITGIKADVWNQHFVMVALAILLLSTIRSAVAARVLGNAPLRYLGNLSYAIYLVHMPVLNLVGFSPAVKGSPLLYFAASLAGTILLAACLFHGLERPARTWLRGRWSNHFHSRLSPAV